MPQKEKSNKPKDQKEIAEEVDPVTEADDESFPASDAPAWTSSGDGRSELRKKRKKSS